MDKNLKDTVKAIMMAASLIALMDITVFAEDTDIPVDLVITD